MDSDSIKNIFKDFITIWKKFPFQLISILIILTMFLSSHYNSEINEIKYNNGQLNELKDQEISLLKNEKDKYQMESIKCNVNNEKINLNISNNNLLNYEELIYNGSCIDKDYTISRLFVKLNEKDEIINESIILIDDLETNLSKFKKENIKLNFELDKIPESEDFLDVDINITNGNSFEADNGKFLITLKRTNIQDSSGAHQAVIYLLSEEKTIELGEQHIFNYNGENYTMNVKNIWETQIRVKFFKNQ